jgi:hypothetical protein
MAFTILGNEALMLRQSLRSAAALLAWAVARLAALNHAHVAASYGSERKPLKALRRRLLSPP